MKKLIIISLCFISINLFGQSTFPIRPDTIKHIAKGNDTKMYHSTNNYELETNKDTFNFNKPVSVNGVNIGGGKADSAEYSDTSGYALKSDSSWKEITAEVANIDTVKTQYIEGPTVTFSNNIYSENNITATNQLISRGRLLVGTSGTITGGYQSEIDNIDGLLNLDQDGATTNNLTVPLLNINRTSTSASSNDITANIINITDSPTTSGTVSGKVLSASIDGTERISLNPRSSTTGTAYYFDTDLTFTTGNLLAVANNADTLLRVTKDTLFADSLTAKVQGISIGGSETVTGANTSKFVMENTNTDKLQTDTLISETDSITLFDIQRAVRKILYPNNYTSYLPNDSIYTTPSITLNVPTKVLVPTAIKYSRSWNLFDKGGSDFALRYEGADSSRFHITMTTSMRTSASNVVFEIFMYKNGVIEPGVAIERKIGTGADVGAISVTGEFDVNTNDYIEIFVLVDVTTTITFSKTSIVIKEDGLIPIQ